MCLDLENIQELIFRERERQSGLLYTPETMDPMPVWRPNAFGQNFNVTMTQMVASFLFAAQWRQLL